MAPEHEYNFVGMKNATELARLGSWERSVRRNPFSPPKSSLRVADDHFVADNSYILSFEAERFYRGCRYYWMICSVEHPDELMSWGHAPTRALAETAAGSEVDKLESGSSKTGRVRQRIRHRPQ